MRAIVLAAGMGKRLQSEQYNIPKVLRTVLGKPLIEYVLHNINFIKQSDTYIVVGYRKDMVIDTLKGDFHYVEQTQQLGTGHAVMAATEHFRNYDGNVLALYGDMPLLKRETFEKLVEVHASSGADAALLSAIDDNPPDYGRLIRDAQGKLIDIIEKKDCTPEQVKIKEVNVGVYVFKSNILFESLSQLTNNNSQKEYYLTDLPKILIKKNKKVVTYTTTDINQIYGINTPEDLELCEKILKESYEF